MGLRLLFAVVFLASGLVRACETLPVFDVHYHDLENSPLRSWFGEDPRRLAQSLPSCYRRTGQFMIANGYNHATTEGCPGHGHEFSASSNSLTAAAARQASVPTIGFCGIDLRDDAFLALAHECLSEAPMAGIKLHFSLNHGYLVGVDGERTETYQRLHALAALVSARGGIFLIHFNQNKRAVPFAMGGHAAASSEEVLQGDPEEVAAFLDIASEAQGAHFVIAHSGLMQTIGLDGLTAIGDHFRANPGLTHNIYLDTSAILASLGALSPQILPPVGNFSDPDYARRLWEARPDVTRAWRSFGIDHVLFGSDHPVDTLEGAVGILRANPALTEDEFRAILHGNAQRMLGR